MKIRFFATIMIAGLFLLSMQLLLHAKDLTPQEIYELKQKALAKLDYQEFMKYVSKENLEAFQDAKDPKQLLFLIKSTMSPVEYEFIGQELKKNEAILYLKGKKANPKTGGTIESGFGKASFKKEGNEWKFHSEEWQQDPWKR